MGVHVEDHDGCAVVRMEAGKVNAMDLALCEDLSATFSALPGDGARAVVLTGNGRAFSAGVDLRAIVDGGGEHARAFVAALAGSFEAVLRCPLPVAAAVDGQAIAGGYALACAADHRVAVDSGSARIGLTELAVGVPFPTTAVEIMRWRLGDPLLGRRVLLADTVPPTEAVAARLADELAPADELLERALAGARTLAAVPTASYALTKAQLQADCGSASTPGAPAGSRRSRTCGPASRCCQASRASSSARCGADGGRLPRRPGSGDSPVRPTLRR